MSHNDVIIDTATLPDPVTAVWSPRHRTLIVSTTATHTQAEQAWAELSNQPFPGLPQERRSA